MRARGGPIASAVALLALGAASAGAPAAAALEPGVQVDPGSPAAKEYALPLNEARRTGAPSSHRGPSRKSSAESSSPEPASQQEGAHALFGAGIQPPSSGAGHGAAAAGARAGAKRARRHGSSRTSGSAAGGAAAPPAVPASVLRAARSQTGSSTGSVLALLGGGVAILAVGAYGGIVLRHSRRPRSSN